MNKLYKFENGKRIRALVDIMCPVCRSVFEPRASKDIYCSRSCYYEMKRLRKDRVVWTDEMRDRMSRRYTGSGNPMFGKGGWSNGKKRPEISGDKHPRWKGGRWISNDGYKIIENSQENNGERIMEHRKVVEEHIGRKLLDTEIVHHKNENKLDNRIENLEIMSRAEHINHHRKVTP